MSQPRVLALVEFVGGPIDGERWRFSSAPPEVDWVVALLDDSTQVEPTAQPIRTKRIRYHRPVAPKDGIWRYQCEGEVE